MEPSYQRQVAPHPDILTRAAARLQDFIASLTDDERAAVHAASLRSPEGLWPPSHKVRIDCPPVEIFSLPTCPACTLASVFLAARGAKVNVRDVTTDRAAARRLIKVRRGVAGAVGIFPLITVGEDVGTGFD